VYAHIVTKGRQKEKVGVGAQTLPSVTSATGMGLMSNKEKKKHRGTENEDGDMV
jgi:hypothetical protein